MAATAYLKNNRETPRKVRLVANVIKGKSVEEALVILSFMPKRAAISLKKLVQSALSNAQGTPAAELIVKDIRVDKGLVMRRFMPRARGSAAPIKKRMSHVEIVLAEKTPSSKKQKAVAVKS